MQTSTSVKKVNVLQRTRFHRRLWRTKELGHLGEIRCSIELDLMTSSVSSW